MRSMRSWNKRYRKPRHKPLRLLIAQKPCWNSNKKVLKACSSPWRILKAVAQMIGYLQKRITWSSSRVASCFLSTMWKPQLN
ncbi:Uncharacterised protein [Vibrio cholerae]|nr:Uncharacterised protein [Vibrio cholerae]